MAKKEPNIFIKILQDLGIIQKEECESKKSLGNVVFMDIILRFLQIFAFTLIFLLLSSHMLWTLKNFNLFDYYENIHQKPYALSKSQWLPSPIEHLQSGGNPLLYSAANHVGKAAVKNAIKYPKMSSSRTRSAGSSITSNKGLAFPYDLLNGNGFGDWFSRTVAFNQSTKGYNIKKILDFLNKMFFNQGKEKTSIWMWFKTIPIWGIFVMNIIISCSSFYTGFMSGNYLWWDTIVRTLGIHEGMANIFPNSEWSIFYILPIIPWIFITTIMIFLGIYNIFNFGYFILLKNYFTGNGEAKDFFVKHFFQPLTLTLLAFCIALYVTFFAMFNKCVDNPSAVKGVCGGFLAFEVLLFVLILKDEWPNIKAYFTS
jgi:hypothetical protein